MEGGCSSYARTHLARCKSPCGYLGVRAFSLSPETLSLSLSLSLSLPTYGLITDLFLLSHSPRISLSPTCIRQIFMRQYFNFYIVRPK